MSLSFKEKRALTKVVHAKVKLLESGGLTFKEKRTATKELNEAVKKLGAQLGAIRSSKLLDKLVAGDFNKLAPLPFIAKVREVVESIGNDVKPVLPPVIEYVALNKGNIGIMESAILESVQMMGSPVQFQTAHERQSAVLTIDIDHDFKEPAVFRSQIRCLESASAEDEITLKINSLGGRTDAAKAFYVALMETKAKTKAKLLTAHSSGAIVAFACDEIELTPHCEAMIHNASYGMRGKVNDVHASAAFSQQHLTGWYNELFQGFLSQDEIDDVMKGQDMYFGYSDLKDRLDNWTPIRQREGR